MQMAKPRNIAPIRRETPLQLIPVRISHSLRHRERQTSSSENMPAVDSADERVHEAQDVSGIVLCVGRGERNGGGSEGEGEGG